LALRPIWPWPCDLYGLGLATYMALALGPIWPWPWDLYGLGLGFKIFALTTSPS